MENEKENEKTVGMETERNIYGSFSLAGIEFALSVKSIQEVINEPGEYSPMPLAPDYLLGLFNLRGVIIPVVDLRKIFELNDKESKGNERKIAIIEHGQFCVGLLFDGTGEVFNGNEEEKSEFNCPSENIKDSVIEGVFKLDEGKRIIQILDAHKILNLEHVPQSKGAKNENVKKRKMGKRKQCISFLVGKAMCAIGIAAIQEVIDIKEVNNSVLSDDICMGAVDIRGNTVPIIDFSNLLGYGKTPAISSEPESSYKVIVMKIADESFGLLVKSIESIVSYFEEDLIGFPVLGDKKKEMFLGCISSPEYETILLNHEKILSSSEIETITRGHSNLYKEKTDSVETIEKDKVNRKSYITFSIDNNYALEINEVKEVIDYPEELIQPPNMSKYFRGMLNLRGGLVAVIDARVLYNMNNKSEGSSPKVLIFSAGERTYGLVVDSVDSIVSFSENEKVKMPELVYISDDKSLTEDVKEAVQVEVSKDVKKTLLILNLLSISSRVESGAAA